MVLKLVKCTPPVTLKGGVEGGGRVGLNNSGLEISRKSNKRGDGKSKNYVLQ